MVKLTQKENELCLSVKDKLIFIHNGNQEEFQLPSIKIPKEIKSNQSEVFRNENKEIICVSFSQDGNFVAIATQNRQMVVLNKDFNVVTNFVTNRTVSKIRFTKMNEIVFADKVGDAYLYKLDREDGPIWLLGHLSIILDVLVTDCGKYIITCDRDEKIRVSHFPNTYNILCYCLGHREFVTNIEVMNIEIEGINSNILISASGDGTLRTWNYLNGQGIDVIDTNCFIKDIEILKRFSDEMDSENVDVQKLPITDMQMLKQYNLVAVSLLNFENLLLFILSGCKLEYYKSISVGDRIICFSLGFYLYIMTSKGIICNCFENCESGLILKRKNEDKILMQIFLKFKSLFENFKHSVKILYKRKFDNVQEYLERKKQRLENKK